MNWLGIVGIIIAVVIVIFVILYIIGTRAQKAGINYIDFCTQELQEAL